MFVIPPAWRHSGKSFDASLLASEACVKARASGLTGGEDVDVILGAGVHLSRLVDDALDCRIDGRACNFLGDSVEADIRLVPVQIPGKTQNKLAPRSSIPGISMKNQRSKRCW